MSIKGTINSLEKKKTPKATVTCFLLLKHSKSKVIELLKAQAQIFPLVTENG